MNSNTYKKLNELSDAINDLYGYVSVEGANFKEPSINSGPCGPFANVFFHCWNQRFNKKVSVVFVMVKNSDECWHILIRLPDGLLFDGGTGVHDEKKYVGEFEIKDMRNYDRDLLERHAYSLEREYPRYCPTFSSEAVTSLIRSHLEEIEKGDWV